MKNQKTNRIVIASVATLATFTFQAGADQTRSATADALNLGTAWASSTAPNTADVAFWDAASTLANTMGANNTWGGLNISAASGAVTIDGDNALLLDHATNSSTVLNTGANAFTWGAVGVGGGFNINGDTGTSAITAGATFSGSGPVTISSTGTKNWSTNGGTNGVTNVSFTGTFALRGAAVPAAGALPGNWLAFGGGGGAASDDGTLVQTGSFALDTGDLTSAGALILTQAWSGQFLKLNSLSGTGSIRADWGVSTGIQTRGIELDQAGDTVLSGSLLAHANPTQRRNVSLVKKGAGKLTLTGGLGTSGGTANLNFDVQAGTIQIGNGMTNPVFVGTWDPASTFTVASGALLRFETGGDLTWSRTLTGGTGDVEIDGEGDIIGFTADNSAFGGNFDLIAGTLSMGPNLGSGSLTVRSDSFLTSGTVAAAGTSQVGALVLEDASESDFRLGLTSDRINVTGALTPPADGELHTINLLDAAVAGGMITLIDYGGTALTAAEFARFALVDLTVGTASYALVDNTANTSIDLLVTLEDQVWKGSTDGNWDFSTTNWALASTPGTPVAFSMDNPAVFDDTASNFSVIVDGAGVDPLTVGFNNSANAYTLTGGEIFGTTGIVKDGTANVTLAQPNVYTGGTTVNDGKLQIGAGGTEGDIGFGAVVVETGAILEFNRSNVTPGTADLDYKTDAKMRDVSGAGDIVLAGGVLFFNYTGGGIAFNSPGTWSGFSGDLIIKDGSEFQTIRNGANAMGTGSVILGDGGSSGTLSVIEGNWTLTNNISLVGSDNIFLNRGTGSGRSQKLQGVISGAGNLTLDDATGAINNIDRGIILTGANTMSGMLTIATDVPVRVGGVPGNADVNQANADDFGSLGTAAVVNNGTLTFTRTDAHVVANTISGSGALRVGIPLASGFGDTSTQVVTLSGANSYAGDTTVANSTLAVNGAALPNGGSLVIELGGVVAPTGTEVVNTLFIEGVQQPAGTYGATGSGASAPADDVHFSGTAGVISVTTGPSATPYDMWLALYTFEVGDDTTPTGDPDGDGLTNDEEFAFGLDPTDGGSVNPISEQLDKTTGTFKYTRYANSGLDYNIETSTMLSGWTVDAGATASQMAGPVDGRGNQEVTVMITGAPLGDPKFFVRVNAVEPAP